jgi:gamma-glutamyltranspeptidase/glutathione hydrolase
VTALAPVATRYAPNGMVCAVDHLAASAGVAMLRAGGSAADAAVAASAVLAVTTQHMCGMGGDLFAVVHAGSGPPTALNASGRAGSGADPARLRAEDHQRMPFFGDIRSVPVPGCVDGWLALHERYGRLPLADVLAPAWSYAEEGFPATATLAASVQRLGNVEGAEDYTAGGFLHPGDVVKRPGVARALAAIAADGRDAFYRGEFGEALVTLGAGEYVEADLERNQAEWVEPISARAWGHDVWTVPPNSQGYLTLAGAWIAEKLDLPGDPGDPLWAHLTIEAARQAAYDRNDALHEHADGAALVASDRLEPRRLAIDPDGAAPLGDEYGDGGTIYLCAVDRDRMGVSLIQSNAAGFGALLVVPGLRIFLQNRGIGFSLIEGHPAEYGPGRRPPHTLSPALVTRPDGSLRMVIGTMGGDSQPQILLQLLARLLATHQSPGSAVAAGRWVLANLGPSTGFSTWDASGHVRVQVEGHAPPAWDDGLEKRGHAVRRIEAYGHGFGHAHVIGVEEHRLAGASDPRTRAGAEAGY